MHPARIFVEPLVDKELSPGHGTVGIEAFLADDMDFAAKIERGVRIDKQHGIPGGRVLTCNRESVRPPGLVVAFLVDDGCRLLRQVSAGAVERPDTVQRNLFNIAADRTLEEEHWHPRLESGQHLWLHFRVRRQVVVEAVGKRVAKLFEPVRRRLVCGYRLVGRHVKPRAQVAEQGFFTLGLRQPAYGPVVIPLHPWKVVLGLGVEQTEHRVRISLGIDMRHAKIVADYRHVLCSRLEAIELGRFWRRLNIRRAGAGREKECGKKKIQQ